MGTNANLVDLDLLTAAPINPLPPPSGPSPANPFGLSTSPATSLIAPKPVGNPFDNRTVSPSLIQLASNNTDGFGGIYNI